MADPASAIRIHPESLLDLVAWALPRSRPGTLRTLVSQADIRRYPAGQTVLEQGERERTVLVVDGHVGVRRTTADGREVIPIIVTAGQFASVMPLAGRPAALEAVALSPSTVALINSTALLELAQEDVGLALDLLANVLQSYEAIAERLDGLMYQDAVRRVARVLVEHADILFGEPAELSRAYLPGLVGTSQEMTARVLRKLESNGVVARASHDSLQLLDPDRLAQMATATIGESEHVHGGSGVAEET